MYSNCFVHYFFPLSLYILVYLYSIPKLGWHSSARGKGGKGKTNRCPFSAMASRQSFVPPPGKGLQAHLLTKPLCTFLSYRISSACSTDPTVSLTLSLQILFFFQVRKRRQLSDKEVMDELIEVCSKENPLNLYEKEQQLGFGYVYILIYFF